MWVTSMAGLEGGSMEKIQSKERKSKSPRKSGRREKKEQDEEKSSVCKRVRGIEGKIENLYVNLNIFEQL